MTTHTTVRSWAAIGVGVFFTLVTAWVLLEDVYHGAPINSKHVMTAAVLAGTIFFGHALWCELRSWRLGNVFGCAVLFLAGTCTCVIMSAGRNAEVTITKASDANKNNGDRKRLERNLIEAKAAYSDAVDGNVPGLKEAKGRYQAALSAEALECATGVGPACLAKRNITAQTRKDVEDSEQNRRILVELRRSDVETAEAALRGAPAEKVANADIKAAAGLISKVPYVTADAGTLEALLLLFFPFSQALFCEIAAIVGYSIGLGHVARQLPKVPDFPRLPSPTVTEAVTVPVTAQTTVANGVSVVADPVSVVSPVSPSIRQPKPKRRRPTDVQLMHAAIEDLGGVVDSQNTLAAYWSISKGEVAKRVDACGDFLKIRRVGRCHEIRINDAFEYVDNYI